MYAVIKTGGKQYRVAVGDRLKVEKLTAEEGSTVELDQVLMVSDDKDIQIGAPLLDGVSVSALVKSHGRGDKIKIVKIRRRKHSRTQMGHRQDYTELEITSIGGKGAAPKKAAAKKAAPKKADKPATADGDDLTVIKGLGKVMAEKLNAAGVTTYAQIAAWTEADIDKLDAELKLKSKAEKDNWVEAAKEVASK